MSIVIYHNPDCGTSRNTLAMIRASGEDPIVVEYVKTGWTADLLGKLLADMDATPRDVLRVRKSPAEELGLTDPNVSDDTLFSAMLEHPILVNRPIVVTPKGTRLCRPSEKVYALLDNPPSSFVKEDGEVVSA